MERYQKAFKINDIKAKEISCLGEFNGDIETIILSPDLESDYRRHRIKIWAQNGNIHCQPRSCFKSSPSSAVIVRYKR